LQTQLKELSSSAREQRRVFNRTIAHHRAHNEKAQEAFEAQQTQLLATEQSCESFRTERLALESEISRLTTKLELLEHENNERIADSEALHRSHLNEIKSKFDKERSEFTDDISAKEAFIREYSSKVRRLEGEVVHWKRTSDLMRKQRKAAKSELEQSTKRYEQLRASSQDRIESVRDEILAQSEEVLSVVKTKNKELRALCSQNRKLLKTSEEEIKSLRRKFSVLEAENERLTHELSSRADEVQRSRQVIETKTNAAAFQFEAQLQTALADLTAKHEDEKRAIFAYITKNFQEFADESQTLGTDSFRCLVIKVAEELTALRKSDAVIRRLLSLGPRELPEDAVATLVLSGYRK
jgi:DNA repair exonuclease SbcCD ATPase subunit